MSRDVRIPIRRPYSATSAAPTSRKDIRSATSPIVSSGATTSGSPVITSPTRTTARSCSASSTASNTRRSLRCSTPVRPRARPRPARRIPARARRDVGAGPACARNGARYLPTIFAGGHQSGSVLTVPAPPPSSPWRYCGPSPVRSRPRSTGRNGRGSIAMPAAAAIDSAAASACWAAMPPCLTVNVVMSPAAYTSERADHASVRVDRDEALERLRDAADPLALQPRKRDDAIGREDVRRRPAGALPRVLPRGTPGCAPRFRAPRGAREPRRWPRRRTGAAARSSGVTRARVSRRPLPRAASQPAVRRASS